MFQCAVRCLTQTKDLLSIDRKKNNKIIRLNRFWSEQNKTKNRQNFENPKHFRQIKKKSVKNNNEKTTTTPIDFYGH